jgi:hypothetical protein
MLVVLAQPLRKWSLQPLQGQGRSSPAIVELLHAPRRSLHVMNAVPMMRPLALLLSLLLLALLLAGCGAVAAPCRVASAALKIVPVVGHVAAAPTDACAEAIDP